MNREGLGSLIVGNGKSSFKRSDCQNGIFLRRKVCCLGFLISMVHPISQSHAHILCLKAAPARLFGQFHGECRILSLGDGQRGRADHHSRITVVIVQDPVGMPVSAQEGALCRHDQLQGRSERLVPFHIRVAPHLDRDGLGEAGSALEED